MKRLLTSLNKVYSRIFSILLGLIFLWTQAVADTYEYSDSWGNQGYSVESVDGSYVLINYSISSFNLNDVSIKGEMMKNLEIPGEFLPNNAGAPNLPGNGRYLAIPQGSVASFKVVSYRTEVLSEINLSPAPRIPWETEDGPLEYNKDMSIYSANKYYPENPVQLSASEVIRGVDVVMLGITPFQYNPVTRELVVYRDIKIEVTFKGGNGQFGENRLRSRWWDPLLSDMLLNFSSLPQVDYNKSYKGGKDTGCEYLIITPTGTEFQAWADTIRNFRTLQGIQSQVITLDEIGSNNANAIENYIDDAYYNWDIVPAAVLLIGDYGTNMTNTMISPIWDSYCVSDNIYADVTENDMPDIVFARMTAQNEAQLEVMVTKFLDHERTPPTNPDYYTHPITACGWQTERWFQLCSEIVGGYWREVHGKDPERINAIYSGTPGTQWSTTTYGNTAAVVDYFGPNGLGYIPASPSTLGGWTGGNATAVNNAINNGAFMMQHRDHGGETGWGEPDYSSSDINGLHNTDLTFVWSVNCLTGKYNYSSEVFSEKFHRYTYNGQNSGALGIIAASEVSYSFVNDAYVWGAYDNMWPDFMPTYGETPASRGVLPAFANAAGKYFLQQSDWPYNTDNKEVTYNLFHHHGDAFMTVYSEMPQNLTVVHNPILYAGVTSFDVSANSGSLIALTVDGEIIGTAEGIGAPVSILIPGQVPPDQVLVTVTKQNYYRYESLVDVIPPSGPYVVRESYTINDTQYGNGDGLMDYGETNMLSLTVENVGVTVASGVTVTINSADEFISITDNTEYYGNIAAGATATVTDGFAYDVANDIPDDHNVSLEVTATDGTNVWTSYFSIPGHAPVLGYVDFTISDPTGNNNGKIDPGETVDITIEIENTGSSGAFSILGSLTESDPMMTINDGEFEYGDLEGGNTANGTFSVTASPSTPAGHMVDFTFDIEADLGITGSGAFSVVVGQIPVLVLNLDPNNSSAPEMGDAIDACGVAYESMSSFPADLNLYSSVFVCLGIYSSNHVLTSSEGQTLANYLNSGGALYMEGGDTWAYDSQTAAHSMFNIEGTDDGSSDMSTVQGLTGTFTAGMSFSYSGENNYMDRLTQIAPAFKVLQNQSPNYGTAVAYDAGNYKTIGTSHEFGGLDDGSSPSTKQELMYQYLNFFGILQGDMAVAFEADETEVCEGSVVEFTDNSFGSITSWEWEFEGGNPATSTLQNPDVTYNTAGSFDVTLTISDGSSSMSQTYYDYIEVNTAPGTPGTPSGSTMVCANSGSSTAYSTTGSTGATSYDWVLDPASAGNVSGSGSSVTVDWSESFLGEATLKVAAENECGTSSYSNQITISVYLPEVTLEPFAMVCENEPAFELTGGWPEGGTYSGTGVVDGWFYPADAGVGSHTITYTYVDPNTCENYAEEQIVVDPCTGIGENVDASGVTIFPNPNDGNFTLKIDLEINDLVNVQIFDALNEVVFEANNISTGQLYSKDVNLNGFAKGVYFLRISGKETNVIKKVVLR
ncbi:MAG: T9SS type A sorting domain-containing protein [Bacteroidales bacterium]|nr:T9SS type A sorting domain-containing protein [Bacteroidales bacterium]